MQALARALPEYTAALQRHLPPHGTLPPAALDMWVVVCAACCLALNTLLDAGTLQLPDQGWTRLLAAAGKRPNRALPAKRPGLC